MQTHGLLLDFGRVIADFDHLKPCSWIGSKTGHSTEWVRERLFGSQGPAIRHEEGMSSLQFYNEVCGITGLTEPMETFFSVWGDIFTESRCIKYVLGRIAPHVKIGIVSNTDPVHWKHIERLSVMREFFPRNAYVTTSFMVHMRKPNRKIFERATENLGVDISRTLYIDDVEGYVSEFRKLGGKAEVYNCSQHPLLRLERILRSHQMLDD